MIAMIEVRPSAQSANRKSGNGSRKIVIASPAPPGVAIQLDCFDARWAGFSQ
jgi:hypothetical protein